MDHNSTPNYVCIFASGPTLEESSISSVAKTTPRSKVFTEMPVYTHWFALSLYDISVQCRCVEDDLELQFCGTSYKIEHDVLHEASQLIENGAGLRRRKEGMCTHGIQSNEELRGCDLTYSSIFYLALTRLLGANSTAGIIHQGPVRKRRKVQGNPDTADLLGVKVFGGEVLETVFVSDLKLDGGELAEKETALYGKFSSMIGSGNRNEAVLILGLAATDTSASLWLYLMAKKKVWAICIKRGSPWDFSLLATLYVGIKHLADYPISYGIPIIQTPFKGRELCPLMASETTRTFRSADKVLKFFDENDRIVKNNVDIVKLSGLDGSIKYISSDCRFSILTYPFLNGTHVPTSIKQFRGIIRMLDKLHVAGYVHGDIRLCNLVFSDNGLDGYLIDYDLAGKANVDRYPAGYKAFDVRHECARAGQLMCFSHDRFSIAQIIEQHYKDESLLICAKLKTQDALSTVIEIFP